jgi:RNA-directed DNA polymerase
MTANIAGAAPQKLTNWHVIDWQQVTQHTRRLQARIVKATQEGRWGKVKALQHLLTRSFSGKALAVRRVTENQGRKTPGMDGITWNTPEQKAQAIDALRHRTYRPKPLRRIYIPKKNGKKRPLGIPTMHDRAMQALHLLALNPVAETLADPNSYGFRPERSTADAIEQCFTVLAQRHRAQWVLEGDIRACFDKINHDWLLAHIPTETPILQKWLKAGYMEDRVLYPTEEGTPQGGIISPVLANLTLDGLERTIQAPFQTTGRARKAVKVNVVRYADDFIVTGSSQELLEQQIKPLIEKFLSERGLELSPEKTCITHIENGFDFLGQNVRKYNGKLLIKPASKNVRALLDKVRGIINTNKQATAGNLILQLNPVIRGWANYHRHVVSKRTFTKVDSAIFQAIRRWIRRRHPKKSLKWIRSKYYLPSETDQWIFVGTVTGKAGKPRTVRLFKAERLPIKRHTKIQGAANPYDPEWEMYFERRLDVKMASDLRGRRKLLRLWKAQEGICPVCEQRITHITGWHQHHLVRRVDGGSDQDENLMLLHPNCHRQVHSAGLTVVKPHPSLDV